MEGLKADLHTHADFDGKHRLPYSSRDLIRFASSKGFEVLAITHHDNLVIDDALAAFAKKNSILLISGVEKKIEGKEVPLYGLTREIYHKLNTFDDLERLKGDIPLVIAPHPFFIIPQCLGNKLAEYHKCFDAVEYSHFYINFFNRNLKAVEVAKRYRLPLIGTSDAHHFYQADRTYSIVGSEKDKDSVFAAIKKSHVRLVTRPLPLASFARIACWGVLSQRGYMLTERMAKIQKLYK